MPNLEIEFNCPCEENGYLLFSTELENDPNILFHGTSESCALLIIDNGFNPTGNLPSSSFARASAVPLGYACEKRTNENRGAVLAVRFNNLNVVGIRQEENFVYLDDHQIQPEIVAYSLIPVSYRFV